MSSEEENKMETKNDAVFKLVYLGFIISGAISLLVIGGVIVITLVNAFGDQEITVPSVLENWGGIIVGFYFGSFLGLIKDYMKNEN